MRQTATSRMRNTYSRQPLRRKREQTEHGSIERQHPERQRERREETIDRLPPEVPEEEDRYGAAHRGGAVRDVTISVDVSYQSVQQQADEIRTNRIDVAIEKGP